jgi:hypothetical protein
MASQVAGALARIRALYLPTVTARTAHSQARADFISYLAERIQTLWLIKGESFGATPIDSFNGDPPLRARIPATLRPLEAGLNLAPTMSLTEYIHQIAQFCEIGGEALLRAMFLLGWFRYRNPHYPFSPRTVYRLMLAALCVSYKYGHDAHWPTKWFATCGMVPPDVMVRLERDFVFSIQWDVAVPDEQLERFLAALIGGPKGEGRRLSFGHLPFPMFLDAITVDTYQDAYGHAITKLSNALNPAPAPRKPAPAPVPAQPFPSHSRQTLGDMFAPA